MATRYARAAVRTGVVSQFADLGEPAAAPLMERALRIEETAYGPDHPEVATVLSHLALILRDFGEPAAARLPMERAQHIIDASTGPERPTGLLTEEPDHDPSVSEREP